MPSKLATSHVVATSHMVSIETSLPYFTRGEQEELSNWWPISLFKVAYKIYIKSLQRCLQSFFSKVNSSKQTTNFSTRNEKNLEENGRPPILLSYRKQVKLY
jgi:hypothetical protein